MMLRLCHHKDGCQERPEGCKACFQCQDITMSSLIKAGLTPKGRTASKVPRLHLSEESDS